MIEKTCAGWADHIITTQSTSKDLLVKSGIRASKITVILNVPDEDVFKQMSKTVSNNSHFSLITHGTLVERYRVQTLIKAVPMLIKEIPELKVKIVGDGEYQSKLEELARATGVGEYVDFVGRVPFREIPAHIAQANIGIVAIPTGMNPAIPLKLLEYLAMGKPTVVNTFPTIQAYFDESSMMFFKPDDEHDLARCVLELYRNPEKRVALATAGTAVYQKYRWSLMKLEYFKVFDQYIEGKD
jgi:glycosyltransferase involved in cell wall biosynthesis